MPQKAKDPKNAGHHQAARADPKKAARLAVGKFCTKASQAVKKKGGSVEKCGEQAVAMGWEDLFASIVSMKGTDLRCGKSETGTLEQRRYMLQWEQAVLSSENDEPMLSDARANVEKAKTALANAQALIAAHATSSPSAAAAKSPELRRQSPRQVEQQRRAPREFGLPLF